MKTIFILFLIVAAVGAVAIEKLIDKEWETFKVKFNKAYESDIEEGFRKKIFMQNRYKITVHNKKFELGQVSYELGMNQFGDMLNSEFADIMNGFNRTRRVSRSGGNFSDDAVTFIPPENIQIPNHIDWRTKGAVTPIKNQGQCGSCWAFSATGSLEGQHFRKTHKLVSLSEQNLIDCSEQYGNEGCGGGWMEYAFAYVKGNHGIDTERSYPYEAINDRCRYKPANSGATDKGYVDIESGSEEKLQQAVATVGPISVAIDASGSEFQLYKQGIFYDADCSPETLDHGVLAVGYGTDKKTGQDYWIVKNSWGEQWGDDGYILMSRNRDNNCGIATKASYPIV